jgi:hypothetical protein
MSCAMNKCSEKHNKTRNQLAKKCQADIHDKESFLQLLALPSKEQKLIELAAIVCHCCKCTLAKQPDFLNQKTGLEEVYDRFNELHGTRHQCKMLPKFHPELNPIERGWSRMKRYIRRHTNGKLSKLVELIRQGLDQTNLPVCLIRKYCRLERAYLIAYEQGQDFVTAEKWIKKRRSHRSYSTRIDDALDQLYFPMGVVDDDAVVTIIDENDDEEEYVNPEEELLDENDVLLLVLDVDGGGTTTTTSNNEEDEDDYDYSHDFYSEELFENQLEVEE